MDKSEPAITTKNLRKEFDGKAAVENLSLEVRPNTITALLGGNGAGKTTTLSMLLGLMLPTAGEIRLFGIDLIRDPYSLLPIMNFSSPYVDIPGRLTVRQNLTVFGNLYNVPKLKNRIAELTEDLRMGDFLDRPHGSLSAGQKTRSSLAKSLLNEPRLLLLDEPTASLDPDTADWVRTLLIDYQKKTKATIFMASHNMPEVERMCDDVIIMRKGFLVARGSPADLIASYGRDNLEEVFLDIARNRQS